MIEAETRAEMPLLTEAGREANSFCACYQFGELAWQCHDRVMCRPGDGVRCTDEAGADEPWMVSGFLFQCRTSRLGLALLFLGRLVDRCGDTLPADGKLTFFVRRHKGGGYDDGSNESYCFYLLAGPDTLVDAATILKCLPVGIVAEGATSYIDTPSSLEASGWYRSRLALLSGTAVEVELGLDPLGGRRVTLRGEAGGEVELRVLSTDPLQWILVEEMARLGWPPLQWSNDSDELGEPGWV